MVIPLLEFEIRLSKVPGTSSNREAATPLLSCDIRIRQHEVTHQAIEVMASGDELTKRPSGRSEGIESVQRQAAVRVGASEIRKLPQEFFQDPWINRLVDARTNLNVAGVQANLPHVRWRNDDITTDEFAPVHVVAKSRRQQAYAIATLAKNLVCLLEYRNAGPLQVSRIDRDIFLFGDDLQPVIEPSDHNGAYRPHGRNFSTLLFASGQTALHRFRHRDALWQGEANRRVDADPEVSRFLDGGNACASYGNFHDHVGRKLVEFLGLPHDGLGVAIEPWIGLYREPSVPSPMRIKDRLQ